MHINAQLQQQRQDHIVQQALLSMSPDDRRIRAELLNKCLEGSCPIVKDCGPEELTCCCLTGLFTAGFLMVGVVGATSGSIKSTAIGFGVSGIPCIGLIAGNIAKSDCVKKILSPPRPSSMA